MFEQKSEPLLPTKDFAKRLLRSFLVSAVMILSALIIGAVGYSITEKLNWIDAILNASMILSGMGPATPMQTTAGKLFASGYALFSGIVFISSTGVIIAPVFHRLLHSFHADVED